jgi:hypothetical protein
VVVGAKGWTRTGVFVVVLFGLSRAQIFPGLLVGVGHCLCLFVLVVALIVALLRKVVKETIFYRICHDLWC